MTRATIFVFVACCHTAPQTSDQGNDPGTGALAGSAPSPRTSATAPDGHDLPAPLYSRMFVDDATFDYAVNAYKVDRHGERHLATKKRVHCRIADVVFMHELRALSATLSCDEPGPWCGVMFAGGAGFWWYDEQRFLAGGFVLDESTKVFDREPKEVQSIEPRTYAVARGEDGAWCWRESFGFPPWTGQGLCFADGRLVSGWASNEPTATAKGEYIEFKLAQ